MPSLIARLQEASRAKDATPLADLLAEDVRLYGVLWKPFEGKAQTLAVFTMLLEIMEDLEYVAEYQGPDGIALRVKGKVGGREFDGVQLFRFDAAGLIDECRDLLRPHSAGTALIETSGEYIARHAESFPA